MKKITVSIACDEEKLSALKMYLAQKDMRVETELEWTIVNKVDRKNRKIK